MFKRHRLKKAFKQRYGKNGKKYYKAFIDMVKTRKNTKKEVEE